MAVMLRTKAVTRPLRNDERQRHRHEDLEAVRAHVIGRFLDGLVDLPQGGDAAARAGRERTHHKHDHQDQAGAVDALQDAGVEQAARETADVSDAEHRARNRHRQHRDRLDEALGLELALDHQVGDDHAEQGRDRRGDERQHKAVLKGLEPVVAGEDQLEPLRGQREELVAPGREQRPDGNADIHHDDEHRRQRAEDGERNLDASVLDEHSGPRRLAREGGGGLRLEVILLHGEHRERDAQQHHGHRGRARLVIGTRDLQVDRGCERVVGSADDHGVGKVRDQGQRLDDDDAPVAVNAVVINPQQEAGDDARLAEEHDHRKAEDKRRRNHRQHGHDLEQAAHKAVHPHIDFDIREQQADQRRQNAHHKADLQRVRNGAGKARHRKDPLEDAQAEGPVAHKTVHQQDRQRIENEQGQKGDQHDNGRHHDRVRHQLLAIQCRALAFCHKNSSSLCRL